MNRHGHVLPPNRSLAKRDQWTRVAITAGPTEDLFGKITYDSEETGRRTVQANEIFQFLSDDQIKRISPVKNVWWSQKQDSSVTCAIECQGRRDIRPRGGARVYQSVVGVERKCPPATGVVRSR